MQSFFLLDAKHQLRNNIHQRQQPGFSLAMLSTFRFLILFLICLFTLQLNPATGATKQSNLPHVPASIEALRRHKDHIFNVGKYDKTAKVYYVYYISSTYSKEAFRKETEFLGLAHKKIFHKGAEIIMHLNYSDEDEKRYQKYKKSKYSSVEDVRKLARQCTLKCPILNSYKRKVRRALSNSSNSEYASTSFRAIDAEGNILAYFSHINDSIVMYDKNHDNRQVLKCPDFESSEWEAAAILASYERLVNSEKAKEILARKAEKNKADEEEAKPKKNKRKANKPKRQKFKPVVDEDEEEDDEEEEVEDDEEEEEDDEDW